MKTERKYYHLIKSVIVILFLSFGMTSCEKEDPGYSSHRTDSIHVSPVVY